jgi:hypothetical protein
VEEAEHSQRRQAAQMKRHHKKIVEAYENFQSIFQVINFKRTVLESCRRRILNFPEFNVNFNLRQLLKVGTVKMIEDKFTK